MVYPMDIRIRNSVLSDGKGQSAYDRSDASDRVRSAPRFVQSDCGLESDWSSNDMEETDGGQSGASAEGGAVIRA